MHYFSIIETFRVANAFIIIKIEQHNEFGHLKILCCGLSLLSQTLQDI